MLIFRHHQGEIFIHPSSYLSMFNLILHQQHRTVLMTIRNLNIDVELIHVNFAKGENKTEEFLKLNPHGTVPVLVDDDGFILSECGAIAGYLVASRDEKSSLYPWNDSIKRALIHEKMFFSSTTLYFSHVQILVRKSLIFFCQIKKLFIFFILRIQ